jgi:hypothetical protein
MSQKTIIQYLKPGRIIYIPKIHIDNLLRKQNNSAIIKDIETYTIEKENGYYDNNKLNHYILKIKGYGARQFNFDLQKDSNQFIKGIFINNQGWKESDFIKNYAIIGDNIDIEDIKRSSPGINSLSLDESGPSNMDIDIDQGGPGPTSVEQSKNLDGIIKLYNYYSTNRNINNPVLFIQRILFGYNKNTDPFKDLSEKQKEYIDAIKTNVVIGDVNELFKLNKQYKENNVKTEDILIILLEYLKIIGKKSKKISRTPKVSQDTPILLNDRKRKDKEVIKEENEDQDKDQTVKYLKELKEKKELAEKKKSNITFLQKIGLLVSNTLPFNFGRTRNPSQIPESDASVHSAQSSFKPEFASAELSSANILQKIKNCDSVPRIINQTDNNNLQMLTEIFNKIKKQDNLMTNIRPIIDRNHFNTGNVERYIYIFERKLNINNYKKINELYRYLNYKKIYETKVLKELIYNDKGSKKYNVKIMNNIKKYYNTILPDFPDNYKCFGSLKFIDNGEKFQSGGITIDSNNCPCCYICGRAIFKVNKDGSRKNQLKDYAIDHIIPVKYAYITRIIECPLNYIPAHKSCNLNKSEKILNEDKEQDNDVINIDYDSIQNILLDQYNIEDNEIESVYSGLDKEEKDKVLKEYWNKEDRILFIKYRYLILLGYTLSNYPNIINVINNYIDKCIIVSDKLNNFIML